MRCTNAWKGLTLSAKGIPIALKRFFLKTKNVDTRRQNTIFSIVQLSSDSSLTSPTLEPATTIKMYNNIEKSII